MDLTFSEGHGRQNNRSHKISLPNPQTYEFCYLHGKGDFAEVTEILRCRNCLELCRWTQSHHMSP